MGPLLPRLEQRLAEPSGHYSVVWYGLCLFAWLVVVGILPECCLQMETLRHLVSLVDLPELLRMLDQKSSPLTLSPGLRPDLSRKSPPLALVFGGLRYRMRVSPFRLALQVPQNSAADLAVGVAVREVLGSNLGFGTVVAVEKALEPSAEHGGSGAGRQGPEVPRLRGC